MEDDGWIGIFEGSFEKVGGFELESGPVGPPLPHLPTCHRYRVGHEIPVTISVSSQSPGLLPRQSPTTLQLFG